MPSPVPFLRVIAFTEAASYLFLLGIAMPLKYLAQKPMAVQISGMIHGLLFLALCVALLRVLLEARWPWKRCLLVFAASFIPLVPFFMDQRLREWGGSSAN